MKAPIFFKSSLPPSNRWAEMASCQERGGPRGTKCLQAQVATAHYPDALAQAQLVAQGEGIEIQPERGRALPALCRRGSGALALIPGSAMAAARVASVHPVGLGEQDTVGEAELSRRHRMLIQLTADMFTVGQGDDGIQAQGIPAAPLQRRRSE